MTPQQINTLDCLAGQASDGLLSALNTLGQDKERGYRKTLLGLVVRNMPLSWCSKDEWRVEAYVSVLNFVHHFIRPRLDDEKTTDLIGFFISRIENMESTT